ncbi:6-phosphogluconolactonase [Kribbella sp. NPDC050470]|uniref:6-phosphogluconolactonase n=1 Tax=unclassified Kribbella TaxID=2644121 RepID=UPI0037ABDF42
MRVTVFPTPTELGLALAERIADGIDAARGAGRPYVLGCPGGRSPVSTYTALAALVRSRGSDLSGLVIAMMDEYVEPSGQGFAYIAPALPHSCRRFAREWIVEPLSAAAGPGRGIRPEHVWVPDPQDPEDYDRRLEAAGGVDLFILASGASDGHIAFNAAGSDRHSRSRVAQLTEPLRRDNLATFPTLASLDQVPSYGVTVGIETIARHSRSAVLVAHGNDKRTAVARLRAARRYDAQWPATIVHECPDPALFVDETTT